MEAVQQTPNDSFSHGWLNNMRQSWDFLEESLSRSFDALDDTAFIVMDPNFFSMRWSDCRDFDFNLPSHDEASLVVNADQIFFNGHLLPLHLVTALTGGKTSTSTHSSDSVYSNSPPFQRNSSPSISSDSTPLTSYDRKKNSKWPAKILRKYLYFLVPLCRKVKMLNMIALRATPRLPGSSPRRSNALPVVERRRRSRVFDAEPASSIHDAVLHCKNSIANSDSL